MMETININMTPCNEVETIHASQNDTSLRKWGIRPYDYDGNDITNQQDKATLVDIKGQTLKWNQFCCKGRYFTRGNNEWQNTYTENGVTFTYLDDYTVRIAGTPTARTYIYLNRLDDSANYPVKQGEKLLLRCSDISNGIDIFSSLYLDNTWKGAGPQKSNKYVTVPSDVNKLVCMGIDVQASLIGQTIDVTVSLNVFNLTKMFGSGNEPTEEEFNALFPLYYPYNSGSLIPFNGNGIKTVGKNLFVPYASGTTRTQNGITGVANADGTLTFTGTSTGIFWGIGDSPVFTLLKGTYTMSQTGGTNIRTVLVDRSRNLPIINIYGGSPGTFTLNENTEVHLYNYIASGMTVNDTIKVMLQFGRSVTEYEPYTSSTLSLPISTYFPTGMKSAGTVYDELTPIKAITRIGVKTFNGSENWAYDSKNALFQCAVSGAIVIDAVTQYNVYTKNNRFDDKSWATRSDGSLGMYYGASYIYIKSTQFADVNALKTWLQSNPVTVYYELATPIETAISPELDLTFNIDKGGTEELLPSSLMNGSVDLGSLTWTLYGANNHEFTAELPNMKVGTTNASIPSLGVNAVANYSQWTAQRPNDSFYKDTNGKLHLRLNPYTTVAELTSALQGVYLWYETTDSTPTTTPLNATVKYPAETKDVYFTYQVSDFLSTIFKFYLVTKGIQIPCELEDDTLVADCTSEISNEPGFFDCKIKAENDLGQIFSNKFQLHIERSPQ